MNLREIDTPEALRVACETGAIGHGEAMLVVLHRIDASNVSEFVAALPRSVRLDLIQYARARLSGAETFMVGRGLALPESSTAIAALREWLTDHDHRRGALMRAGPIRACRSKDPRAIDRVRKRSGLAADDQAWAAGRALVRPSSGGT